MSKPLLQQRAITLRVKGYSINSIAKTISVSKSTVSHWCKNIALSEKQINHIAEQSKHHATLHLLRASEKRREKRQLNIKQSTQQGHADVGRLSKRDLHMVGLGLYWGEGYKKGNQELGFTNSDPVMIVFYIEWLRRIYNINKQDLILRLSINDQHTGRIQNVLKYWMQITKIPLSQFTKTSLIKSKSKKTYINLESHSGTLRVKVRRGTELRRRILGSIDALNFK